MSIDINNFVGGLGGTPLGQRASQTRIRSMNSPEWSKLREELKALNPNERELEEDITLIREMLGRLDKLNQPTP